MDILCILMLWILLCIVAGGFVMAFLYGATHIYRMSSQKWARDLRKHDDDEQMRSTRK